MEISCCCSYHSGFKFGPWTVSNSSFAHIVWKSFQILGLFSAIQKEFNKFIYAGHLHEEMFWIKILNYNLVEIGCCYSYHSGLKLVPWTVLNSFSLEPICHKNPSKFWVFLLQYGKKLANVIMLSTYMNRCFKSVEWTEEF